jgi:metal-responsive CopG/Arc/MetJ family transcriptional regulator
MKTAISLPDPLFAAAEQFANERGLSRSELYAHALQFYLRMHQAQSITRILNQIYADDSGILERDVVAAQATAIAREEW